VRWRSNSAILILLGGAHSGRYLALVVACAINVAHLAASLEALVQSKRLLHDHRVTRHDDVVPARRAALVVSSVDLEVEEISSALPMPADETQRRGELLPSGPVPARLNMWALVAGGDETTHIASHIHDVLGRAEPLKTELQTLRDRDCLIMLNIEWQEQGEPEDLGYLLHAEQIAFLAEIGAMIKVDPPVRSLE
jgi:hypothetical protein